ncbi:dienelactone hydrolase family protein [candidate division KSB1 bacterium]
MSQKIIELHDDYVKGLMGRREFFEKLAILAGGAAAALALLPLLENNYAKAQIIQRNDPRLDTEYIVYPGETGDVRAYSAKPKGDVKLPSVIVIHENRGLNPHIEDVTRRMALEGFFAVAPDALSPLGGTPEDADEARTRLGQLDGESTLQNYLAAVKFLRTHPSSTGKVGCVGFCWGGRVANQVAVNAADLTAAVPYYGSQPAPEDVPKIRASLLLHYGGLDQRINQGIPAFEEALKKASVDYTIHVYEGANHAFNNDTNPERYHEEAAALAWQRTIAFLKEKLKS